MRVITKCLGCLLLFGLGCLGAGPAFALACNTTPAPSVNEDGSVTIPLSLQLMTGETSAAIAVTTQPTHGTLSGGTVSSSNPYVKNFVYKPAANYNGTDSFSWKGSATYFLTGRSCTQTVTITVNAVNDAPTAAPILNVTTDEDVSVTIVLRGSDIETTNPAELNYSFEKLLYGTMTKAAVNSGNYYKFTPKANFNGTTYFLYKASDGQLSSASAMVSVNVAPGNDRPTVSPLSLTTAEDTPVTFTLTATDIDSDVNSLTYSIQPLNWSDSNLVGGNIPAGVPYTVSGIGTITLTGKTVTFLPQKNLTGTVSRFSYKANDETSSSSAANLDFTMTPVNDPPVARNTTLPSSPVINEDSPTPALLTVYGASDVDNLQSELTHTFDTTSAHGGTLERTTAPANFTPYTPGAIAYFLNYAPVKNYSGPDSFTYEARDPAGAVSNRATVSFTVTPQKDRPEPANITATTVMNTPVTLYLGGTDADGDPFKVALVDMTGKPYGQYHGTATLVNADTGEVIFTPEPGFISTANSKGIVKFKLNSGQSNANVDNSIRIGTATITVTPKPEGTGLVANNQVMRLPEGSAPVAFTLSGFDPEGGSLTFQVVTQPSMGMVSGTGANLVYAPAENASGMDTLKFTVTNDKGEVSPQGMVRFAIENVNDAPVAESKEGVVTQENTPVTVEVPATDPDGDALLYQAVASPHGKSEFVGGKLTFTPDTDFNGTATVEFEVWDGLAKSDPATVTITVNGGNDAPMARNLSVTTREGRETPITLRAEDPEGDEISYELSGQATGGRVELSAETNGRAVYTPAAPGEYAFRYKAKDAAGLASEDATVTITVADVPEDISEWSEGGCSGVSLDHLTHDAASDTLFYDNVLWVQTAAPISEADFDALAASAGASAVRDCYHRREDDGKFPSYGFYRITFDPKTWTEFGELIAKIKRDFAFVVSAFPVTEGELGFDAPATDEESTYAEPREELKYYLDAALPGAWEYVAGFQAQGGSLQHVNLSIYDSGVCTDPAFCSFETTGMPDEFDTVVSGNAAANPGNPNACTSGMYNWDDEFCVGLLDAAVTFSDKPFGLLDRHTVMHGTQMTMLMGGANNGGKPEILDAMTADFAATPNAFILAPNQKGFAPYNGVLGGAKGANYRISSYLADFARITKHTPQPSDSDPNPETVILQNYPWDGSSDFTFPDGHLIQQRSIQKMCDSDISNNSWGPNTNPVPGLKERLTPFVQSCPDTLFVKSAGNDNKDLDAEPGFMAFDAVPNVLIVGAVDHNGDRVAYNSRQGSNYGRAVHLYAPQVWTSPATATVSGVAGLLKSVDPGATPQKMSKWLVDSGDGAPELRRLSAAAAVLYPIKEKLPGFIPMNASAIHYTWNGTYSDASIGGETGTWRIDGKKLQIERKGERTSEHTKWTLTGKQKFEMSLEFPDVSDAAFGETVKTPVLAILPKGHQEFELFGKSHDYRFGEGEPVLDDRATAICLKAEYELNASALPAAGAYPVPLAQEMTIPDATVPFAVTGARLTGNMIKHIVTDKTGEDSADSGDEVGYADLQVSCDGDVTADAESNDTGTSDASASSPPTWEVWCETWKPNAWNIGDPTSDGYPDGACCLYWIMMPCREEGPDKRVAGPSTTSTFGCTEDGGLPTTVLQKHSNGCSEPITPCYCRQIDDGNECDEGDIDHQVPTKVYTHFEAALDNVTCSQKVTANSRKDAEIKKVGSDYYPVFDLTMDFATEPECTANATLTIKSVFAATTLPEPGACDASPTTETVTEENQYTVELKWSFSVDKLPLAGVLEKLGEKLAEQMGTFATDPIIIESDSEPTPFESNGQFSFLPEDPSRFTLQTPGFGTGMPVWYWSHGIGPIIDNTLATSDYDLRIERVTRRVDRTVR